MLCKHVLDLRNSGTFRPQLNAKSGANLVLCPSLILGGTVLIEGSRHSKVSIGAKAASCGRVSRMSIDRHRRRCVWKQELGYRKQLARQLRTQYVEGIYDNPVTNSRSLETEPLSRSYTTYYYRDLEMWVRGHSGSLKLMPFESFGAVSYSLSIVTMAVCDIFSVKEWHDL